MQDQDPDLLLVPPVTDRWQTILKVRKEFATELDQMANDLPGDGSKYLRSMSRWFRGPAKLEDALRRPDVMAICLPLIKKSADENISSTEIAQAARLGFCSVGRSTSVSRQLLRRFAYPVLVLMATSMLMILFSYWIAPEFEKMFEEFGIELPRLTLAVLGFSKLVRRWWWIVAAVIAVAVSAIWILNRIAGSAASNWIDRQLMSRRNVLAAWAWHISLLLDIGVPQSEALVKAGMTTGKSWLRQASSKWANVFKYGKQTNEQTFLVDRRFQFLNNAMQLPPSAGKIALLQEVAAYYWDRNRTIGDWWVQLFTAFILWMVGAAVFLAIVSLFMPLIAIVSGLTSSK